MPHRLNKCCFLDLETTGFSPEKDSIIEVALIVYENGIETGRLDRVVRPDKSPLTDFISHLTGISQTEIDECNTDFVDIKDEVKTLVGDAVIIGHNIDFDINFLIANGVDLAQNQRIDTHELSRILLPNEASFALEVLSQKYGCTHENAHRAMSDVIANKAFYDFLETKINGLPADFLKNINTFLETKTDWYAKHLFFNSRTSGEFLPEYKNNNQEENLKENSSINTASNIKNQWDTNEDVSIRFLDNNAGSQVIKNLAQEIKNSNQQCLIVSPKLDYFDAVQKFPTPDVLFDKNALNNFIKSREKLDNHDTTFALKCLWRDFLGYRGLWHFDLFFKERDLWKEVSVLDESNEIFQQIISDKKDEAILGITPNAYFKLSHLEIFKDRKLIIDEAEEVANQLLHFPTISINLNQYLNHSDDNVSQKSQFFIARFVREFIEPKLQHGVTPFPQKILLSANDKLPSFAEQLTEFYDRDDLIFWQEWLQHPGESSVRWLIYYPKDGNLTFHHWHPEDWRTIKTELGTHQKCFFQRQGNTPNAQDFFQMFFSSTNHVINTDEYLYPQKKLVIPQPLISQSSPEFNEFCRNKAWNIFKDSGKSVAFNFSSQETLRTTYEALTTKINYETQALLGERVNGGNGKILELLEKNKDKQIFFCFQKMLNPKLSKLDIETLVIQKFPFSGPHPLNQKLEEVMKKSGKNAWNLWTVPQLTASFMRRIGNFEKVQNVMFLDPRENAGWGRKVLNEIFNQKG